MIKFLFSILFSFLYIVNSNESLYFLDDSLEQNISNANLLKISLLSGYNRDNIPIKYKLINLSLFLNLHSFDLDQTKGIVTYNLWLNYQWTDYQLCWNQTQWNIETLSFNTNPKYETQYGLLMYYYIIIMI